MSIRLGHESLDVTLAYLKAKDAESEETQEHANISGKLDWGTRPANFIVQGSGRCCLACRPVDRV
jgi:hypothetical protein